MAARRRRVLVDVGGSSAEARREIQKVRDEVRRLGREEAEARIDVNERVALAKIQRVQERIERLKGQEASVDVDIKLAGAYAQLDRLNLRLDRLREKRINIDVDIRRGGIETTVAGFRRLEGAANRVGSGIARSFRSVPLFGAFLSVAIDGVRGLITGLSALPGLVAGIGQLFISAFQTAGETIRGLSQGTVSFGSVLSSFVGGVVSLGTAAATAALSLAATAAVAGALIIAINAVAGAIIALTGALVALVASLTAAVAGLGALGVAFAAALGPAILVVIGLFTRFAAILKARKAHEQELATAVQDQKTAEQQRKDALEASRQAHQRLAEATVEGNRAIRDSIFEVRDAQLALDSSKLGVKEARLGLLDAKRSLRELLVQAGATGKGLETLFKQFSDVHVDPTKLQDVLGAAGGAGAPKKQIDPLELQRRVLAVQRAQLGVKESINQTANAERNLASATKKRADFVRQGVNAYKPYRQALEAVRKADERVARAQDQSTAAQRKYERALKGLSGAEKGTLDRLNLLISGFTKLAKAFTDPIFKALNETFDSLKGSGDGFRQALTEVGKAFGDVVRSIGAFLREPTTQSAFKTMAAGAADLVRQLGARAFVSFLRIMREVAVTALPAVRSAARDVANAFGRIAGQPGKIHSAVHTLVGQFKTWAGLAWQVLRAVAGIFRAAAGPGKSLAASLTTIVKRFADWANTDEGQRKLREFFRNMVSRAKQIVTWIKNAVVWLKNHLPAAAKTAKDAFQGVYNVVKKIVDSVRWLQNASKNVAHAFGIQSAPSVKDLGAARGAIEKDAALLHTHLTPEARSQTRDRLIENLQNLADHWVKLSPALQALLNRLVKAQGHASGGMVGGSGRGDIVPAWLEPGEFVLRRNVVRQLSLPVLHALNGGGVPHVASAATVGGGTTIEAHFHVDGHPGQWIDERHLLAVAKEQLAGIVSQIGTKG